MTIDKAIDLLKKLPLRNNRSVSISDYANYCAVRLGIEALKRLKEHREEQIDFTYRALPGETEE